MRLQYVETLVAIDQAGSIRSAAELLGKSQPALTKTLRQAEESLGFSVFRRTSRGVFPTDLGEAVLARARIIHSELQRLNEEVRQLQGEDGGFLHVCLSPLAAVQIIPGALRMFRKSWPKVHVQLSSGMAPTALAPLRQGAMDMVIGPEPAADEMNGLKVQPLLKTTISVLAGKTSKYRDARRLADLLDAKWIMIGSKERPGMMAKLFAENGLEPPVALTTSESYIGVLSIIESGEAICTYPSRLLEKVERSWDIVRVPVEETLAPIQISLMTRADHPLTPAAQALVNCIERSVVTATREPDAYSI